jgi:hypothetical protein
MKTFSFYRYGVVLGIRMLVNCSLKVRHISSSFFFWERKASHIYRERERENNAIIKDTE